MYDITCNCIPNNIITRLIFVCVYKSKHIYNIYLEMYAPIV